MKHKSITILLAVVALSLGLLWLLHPNKEIAAKELQQWIDSLDKNPASIREQAYKLATKLFVNPEKRDKFATELVETYLLAKDLDFLLVYNTGGYGGKTMADDPEWPSVLEGIQEELKGLNPDWEIGIVEHQRTPGYTIASFLGEVKEIVNYYPTKAPLLAAKIAFLTRYNTNLKVIITGRSNGAAFSNEVMELLEDNPRVYSIQAGRFRWYIGSKWERTLLMDNNGIMPDTMARGDFLAIIRANLTRLPTTYPPEKGSKQILKWYIEVPGHTYTWEHPGVKSQVRAFLEENFGKQDFS